MNQQKPTHCAECPLRDRPRISQEFMPNPDILFVGGFPIDIDCRYGAFKGKNSALLRRIVDNIQRGRTQSDRLRIDYAYACQCSPDYDKDAKKFIINADIVSHCSLILKQRIDRSRPRVIIALGADALRALDFKAQPKDMRGGIYHFMAEGGKIPVVATFHIVSVSKSPGYLPTFEKDIRKGVAIAKDGLTDVQMDIRTPTTVEGIVRELDEILSAARKRYEATGSPLGLAVDTETTSLKPYIKEDRVIMVSMSHIQGEGLAYPFEHRQCPFTPEEFAVVRDKTAEVLGSPCISIIMANGKFDTQWLKYHYGLPQNPLAYDVILAEHVLDEDKKGEYSLKDLTRDRFPSMGKYEDELKQHLREVWYKKDEEIARLTEEHKQAVKVAIVAWWVGLDAGQRKAAYVPWVEKGYIPLTDIQALVEVRRRKMNGEMVIPKKYQEALFRLVTRVPAEELAKHMTLPELVIPEELTIKTYEDAELRILLRYAAIDALTTRMVLADQQGDFGRERKRIEVTEKALGRKLPTRQCHEVMRDNTTPLCRCIAAMEYNGVRLDREKCKAYKATIEEKLAEAEDLMFTEVGRKFNTSSSSPDLANILYEEMKLPVKKRTDTGAPSTDADTIKELLDGHDLPFLEKLLVYRKLDKCLHTYIENWLKISAYDGKIHAEFNQIGTATYRLSSSNPNLQNVPFQLKEANLNLKALFLPDSEDYNIVELDVSNAEMRVLTAYSRDKALTDAFNNGKDLHCLTAAGISQYDYDDIKAHKEDKTTDQYRKRQLAKKVNFGTIYCMSAERLQQQLWSELRIQEPIEQCQEYLDKFFETYPGVKAYIDGTKNFVARFGYTWTFTGRRRRFAIAQYNRSQAARMGRQAVNARIQTTSSDLVMYNLIDVDNWLQTVGGRMLLTVHDSLLFQLPKNIGPVFADIKRIITGNTAERAPWLPVEWKFDVGCGPNYGDTHVEVA